MEKFREKLDCGGILWIPLFIGVAEIFEKS